MKCEFEAEIKRLEGKIQWNVFYLHFNLAYLSNIINEPFTPPA